MAESGGEQDERRAQGVLGDQVAPRLLNENHRRVLSTLLRRVELAAWHLEERMTSAAPPDLALTRFTGIPDEAQRATLIQLARKVRREVAQLAREYGLEAREEHVGRVIEAEFTLLWSDLEEGRPHKLRNYGALHPRAHELLGPRIQRLIDLVLAIDSAVRSRGE
jgi:hypothetical protein